MEKMYVLFLVVATFYATKTIGEECGPDETYSNSSSTCPPTCKSLYTFDNCSTQPGCVCNDGYVRERENGSCVPRSDCFHCKRNEEYSTCVGACEPTCIQNKFRICPLFCREGCGCKPGFVRDQQRNCIPERRCKLVTRCSRNEVYLDCGSACPPVCGKPSEPCTKQCVRGCFCRRGHILDTNSTCIPESQCNSTLS